MKRIRSHIQIMLIFTLVVAFCTMTFFTTAAEARRADEVFDSATVSLKTTKKVVYDATTYGTKKSISITNCWLEKKSGSKWIRQCALETPSAGKNTFGYVREMDYSDDIGTGTYRIGATFDADGHSITRYSNSRTF